MKATDIIFKAKSADNSEWVTGAYLQKTILFDHSIFSGGIYREINPTALCIGFKDKHGNAWFAGDMVKFPDLKTTGVIVFSMSGFAITLRGGRVCPISQVISENIVTEITGNIHD